MFRLGTSLHAVTLVGPDGVTRPAPRRVDVPEQAVRVRTGRRVSEAGVRRVERVPQGGAAAVVGLGHEVVQLVRSAARCPAPVVRVLSRSMTWTPGAPWSGSLPCSFTCVTSVSGRVWLYVVEGRTAAPHRCREASTPWAPG